MLISLFILYYKSSLSFLPLSSFKDQTMTTTSSLLLATTRQPVRSLKQELAAAQGRDRHRYQQREAAG